MRPLEPTPLDAKLAAELADTRKRLLDLERRVSQPSVKVLDDLDDVIVQYVDGSAYDPADADVLMWSDDQQQWVPGGGGLKVAWSGRITRTAGTWGASSTDWAFTTRSSLPASSDIEDYGLAASGAAVTVHLAGIWLVTMQGRLHSSPGTNIRIDGPAWSAPGEGQCYGNALWWEVTATDTTCSTGSALFYLPADSVLTVSSDCATLDAYIDLALYMATPIDVGSCGED